MDVREKLVELLKEISYDKELSWYDLWDMREGAEIIADLLIAHGVTVQKWISVKDRLPEYEEPVMGWGAELRDMGIVNFVYGKFLDIIDMSETDVTHWMPLPQPPKGE